jgi:glutamate racemase
MISLANKKIENPIGVFDSGLGGLSVWQELIKLMPNEDIIYFADSGNCPYGNKTKAEIIDLSIQNTEFLLSKGAKIIVIACNTATAAAIEVLRAKFDVAFIGMEPAVKPAASRTKTGHIGVLATKGTLESERFQQTKNKYTKGTIVHMQIGEGLVQAVENQEIETEKTFQLIQKYITPMLENEVDKIVLGCTHYPFLIPIINKIIPPNIELINPAPAVAMQTQKVLFENQNQKEKAGNYEFYTSGNEKILNDFLTYIGVLKLK